MIRVLSRIKSEPWAITREAMETIIEIAQRENESPQAVAARMGRPLENTYDVEYRDGVAILSVTGPMFRYANLFTQLSGATSYDLLARDFARAVDDQRVDAILLNIDSPGGEASGVSEFADMIYQARGVKPVVAYVGGAGASAAYWIASAADEIVVDDIAQLGSIGTVLGIDDSREREAKSGVRRIEIVSSQSPYKRLDPTTDEGRSRLLARVDALSDVFIAKVARNRGVDVDTVMKEFGQGDVFVGQAAVGAGLADRMGSYEGVVSELIARARGEAGTISAATAGGTQEEIAMSDQKSPPAGSKPEILTAAQVAEQHPEAVEAIRAEARSEGAAEARTSERTRVQSILTADEAEGRTDLARHLAFEGDMPAEAAIAMLGKAPKAEGKGAGFEKFDAAMRDAGNPQVGADVESDPNDINAAVERSTALGKQFGIQ